MWNRYCGITNLNSVNTVGWCKNILLGFAKFSKIITATVSNEAQRLSALPSFDKSYLLTWFDTDWFIQIDKYCNITNYKLFIGCALYGHVDLCRRSRPPPARST